MTHNDLSPVSVAPYTKDYLIELIRYKTGWDQRSEVTDKIQLNYLCNYLENSSPEPKTIIVEDKYVDRHYLEDYSEYYARCFTAHPRMCTRVHFFSFGFEEDEFLLALSEKEKDFELKLLESYIGFVVIRPIPHTFLAKVCIKPNNESCNDKGSYKLVTKKHRVSLFGLTLEVDTAAFLEQDKVVSACATSALWMLYSSSSHRPLGSLPSPSAITKSASSSSDNGVRTFPSTGLTPNQVAKSLQYFGLEPSVLSCNIAKQQPHNLHESIYPYIGHGVPLLLGVSIYRKDKEKKNLKFLGQHLVCVLGYHVRQNSGKNNSEFRSHDIDKIYVHDDRYGPFVEIDTSPVEFADDENKKIGLSITLQDKDVQEFFIPEIAIVGLYHKVRIPYIDVRNICTSLRRYLTKMNMSLIFFLEKTEATKIKEIKHVEKVITSIKGLIDGLWDVTLVTNTSIKEDIRTNEQFVTFNGASEKTTLLLKNMPKYIWRIRIWSDIQKQSILTDILIDATEVPQGQMIIGYISYGISTEEAWKKIESAINDRIWDEYQVNQEAKKYIGGFLRFFSRNKEKTFLNTTYGSLSIPKRKLKLGEANRNNNIISRQDTKIIRRGEKSSSDSLELDNEVKYIWVIDEYGDLVMAKDIESKDDNQGHITLINGEPGRLAGELLFFKGRWTINSKSRAYSSHIKPFSEKYSRYLSNVIEYNLRGLDVIAEKE